MSSAPDNLRTPDNLSDKEQPQWQHLLKLSRGCKLGLKGQLRRLLVTVILDGEVPLHRSLPSSRSLAVQLGVARNTVVHVYQQLLEDGYLIAQHRRGYFVNPDLINRRVMPVPERIVCDGANPNWSRKLTTRFSRFHDTEPYKGDWRGYDYAFISDQVEAVQFPINEWRECSRRSLETQSLTQWTADSVDGDDPLLVEQIQRRLLPRRGLWVNKEQILVTVGAQNALYLLAKLLVNSGVRVGIEDPGNPEARSILELRHCEVVPLPVDRNGLIIDDRINDCDLVYCTPTHQSPTNATLSLERRQELLRRASKHDILIVEDEYDSDLNYSGSTIPALKSLDSMDRVIYVGNLSRTLAPGQRLGYIVGPVTLIDEVRALRRLMLRHPPTNHQNTAAHFMASGYYDSMLHRMSLDYRTRWETMDEALKKHFPDSGATAVFGSSEFWLKLPRYVDADELAAVAAKNGILVLSGDSFFQVPPADHGYLRLGFSSIPVKKIASGVAKLAVLVNDLLRFAPGSTICKRKRCTKHGTEGSTVK